MIDQIYILQANLILVLLSMVYLTIYRRYTLFKVNRLLILSIPFIAILFPLISSTSATINIPVIFLPEIETIGISSFEGEATLQSWTEILMSGYFYGCLIAFSLFTYKLVSLVRFLNSIQFKEENGVKIGISEGNFASFSFFNFIVLNRADFDTLEEVKRHERLHISKLHSVDNMIYGLAKCIFWFNPFIYLMHSEIRNIHEYEVDSMLTEKEGDTDYYSSLLKLNPVLKEISFTNSFYSSTNLLNRLKMMKTTKTSMMKSTAYILLIPTLAVGLLIGSCSTNSNDLVEETETGIENSGELIKGDEVLNLSVKPSFPGGMSALGEFIGSEIKYPEQARYDNITGTVLVAFVVTESGAITTIEVRRGVDPLLDEEAIRAISNMPNWIPGEKDGEKVKVEYVLPVKFVLD